MHKIVWPLVLMILGVPLIAHSAASIRLEPLFGVEHSQNQYPEPARYSTRSFFGLRALAGYTLLSAELEATQSNDRRDYPSENLKVEDQIRRAMVGLRSTYALSHFLGFYLRAGARGTEEKNTITNTNTSAVEVKNPGIKWDPYAGTGLQIAFAQNFALNGGATWIFTGASKPDVQYSFGFTVKFGQVR
jgi:hypothetical protein